MLSLCPAPLAAPAILSFLTLVNKISTFTESASFANAFTSSMSSSLSTISSSHEWDCEWGRCVNLGQPSYNRILVDAFTPGSIEGIWEGMFTVRCSLIHDFLLHVRSFYSSGFHHSTPSLLHMQLFSLVLHHLFCKKA